MQECKKFLSARPKEYIEYFKTFKESFLYSYV